MIFLANENIPMKSINYLRDKGLDVLSIIELSPGISDKEVLLLAKKERRIILTFDRDYGYIIFKENIIFNEGLVYFRLIPNEADKPGIILNELLNKGISLNGFFTVVSSNNIRQKSLL